MSQQHRGELEAGKTLRLAMVLGGHWSVQMGGAQYQASLIVDALSSRGGFETHYLARVVPDEVMQPGHTVVPFGRRHHPGAVLRQLPSLYRELVRLRPDIVYQRCLMPYTGAAALYCRRHGVPLVFHIALDDDVRKPEGFPWTPAGMWRRASRAVSEYGLRNATAVVAQTEDQVRMLRNEYGLTADLVVHNFQPVATRLASPGTRDRLRLIWVANLKPSKRPERFVELAEALAGRCDAEFVMIGRPGDPGRYDALQERMGRLPNFRYLGEQSLERVNEEISASDLFVNTSLIEGFPNTFIQSWMRGVPVLSNAVNPDGCLTQGGAGVLAPTVAEMANAVMSFDAGRERLAALGQLAYRYGLENHSPAEAARLCDLLARLARQSSTLAGT